MRNIKQAALVCMSLGILCYLINALSPRLYQSPRANNPQPGGVSFSTGSENDYTSNYQKVPDTVLNASLREQWSYHLPSSTYFLPWCLDRHCPGGKFLQKVYSETKKSRLVNCNKMKRVGPPGGGGKMICLDDISTGCVLYSLGSRLDFSFELDFQKEVGGRLGCTVHTFDCTVGQPPAKSIPAGIHFHPWCVGGRDEVKVISSDLGHGGEMGQYYSLTSIMKKLNHSKVDILKMDIERHEFDVINSFRNSITSSSNTNTSTITNNAAAAAAVPRQMAFEVHVQNAYKQWGRPVSHEEWRQLWTTLDELSYGVLYHEVNTVTVCCAEFVVKLRRRT